MVRQRFIIAFGLAMMLLFITLSTPTNSFAQEYFIQQSMIVVGDSAESAQAAVHSVGAEITHELDIINAVAAQLTQAQATQLAADTRVQRLHINETAYSSATIHTLRDNFSSVAYDRNDGTSEFRSDWVEGQDDDDPSRGKIVIWWGAAFMKGDSVRLRRTANLEDAVNITLSFDYNCYGFDDDDDDYVIVEVKPADGDWIELDRLNSRGSMWVDQQASYDISEYASRATRIRIRNSRHLASDETFKLDNFQIRYSIDNGSGEEQVILADEFERQAFNGNDGTGAWATEWIEENDFGSAYFGNVAVWDGKLLLSGNDNRIRRMADLRDASTATLTYSYEVSTSQYGFGSEPPDDMNEVYVLVEVSADYGATWIELDRLMGETDDFQTVSHNLDAIVGNEIMLRFATSEQTTNSNRVNIDFVNIEYVTEIQQAVESDPFATTVSTIVEADVLHENGITGEGVTVAVIDTGFLSTSNLNIGSNGALRVVAQYDALTDVGTMVNTITNLVTDDDSGHGSHITSIIANSAKNDGGDFLGVAPDVNLLLVKAFSADGAASYADVIRAIDKVVEYKDIFDVRVLNLSFYSTPQSHYWEDPVGQAVMRAWEAGIVVVTGAGNMGPDALSIGVPGNVPYVITVGAITDNYTPLDTTDDYIPPFSSAGPTYDGFVKPEIVAPGAHVLGLVSSNSLLAQLYPQFSRSNDFFSLSGTSMSAAVTSGVVALMLEADPTLTPDDVKCRLIDSARAALDADGNPAFSVFQQGAGVINAFDAVNSTATGCANVGLDVSAELADTAHFVGAAKRDEATSTFYIEDENGNQVEQWSGIYAQSGGSYYWTGGSYYWTGGTYYWTGGTYYWTGGTYYWTGGTYYWTGAELDPAVGTLAVSVILE